MTSLRTCHFQRIVDLVSRPECHGARGILPRLALLLMIPAAIASPLPWGPQSIQQTGIKLLGLNYAALSPSGDIYLTKRVAEPYSLIKVDVTGSQIFAVHIAGVFDSENIWVGSDGNVFLAGFAALSGFVTTPGAYQANGNASINGSTAPFLCKLSGADGHVLFCTYVNVVFPFGFSVDAAGQVYITGFRYSWSSEPGPCVEKLNASGGLVYQTSLNSLAVSYDAAQSAADGSGNLYLLGAGTTSFFLAKLDSGGKIQASVFGNPSEQAIMVLDPAGNPQVQVTGGVGPPRVRRYSADLSKVLFETRLNGFIPFEYLMMIDPNGTTFLLGATQSTNFPLLHPTAVCALPLSPHKNSNFSLYPSFLQNVLIRLDSAGNLIQSTYLPGTPAINNVSVRSSGATLLAYDLVSSEIVITVLGPVPEIQLGCVGNSASFVLDGLAPEELISLFGQNLGPAEAVSGQPGRDNRYPLSLAGTQVTFDGVAAPVFYVSSGQINAVTPRGLQGQTTTHVCVVVNNMPTNCIDAPVQPAAPAIFLSAAALQTGGSQAAALNQDGTINSQSNPAPAGSIVSIFATGLGTITPVPPDGGVIGLPLPAQDLQVNILELLGVEDFTNLPVWGGVAVLYAGPAPYEIEGLSQVNLRLPAESRSIYITSGGLLSARGVTIWMTGQQ